MPLTAPSLLFVLSSGINVQLNMSERENGQQPLPKRTARSRISSERLNQIKTAYASGIRLLRLIEDELFDSGAADAWEGSAEQLEQRLCADNSKCRNQARKLFTFNTACGVYLARLEKKYPYRFISNHTRKGNRWTVKSQTFDEN